MLKSNSKKFYFVYIQISILILFAQATVKGQNCGSSEERAALFDEILLKTKNRESWSPYKEVKSFEKYEQLSLSLREEFINADDDKKLAEALLKLSNLRNDQHLTINPVKGGIEFSRNYIESGVRFYPDFSKGYHSYFVSDLLTNSNISSSISIGDELIAVNDLNINQYVDMLLPFVNYSTENNMKWKVAKILSRKYSLFSSDLYLSNINQKDNVKFTFKKRDTEEIYSEILEYGISRLSKWQNSCYPKFSGFDLKFKTPFYELFLSKDGRNVILLNWLKLYDENMSINSAIKKLLEYAEKNAILNNDLIFYAPFCEGGNSAPEVLKILASNNFKTTFGNVRISDASKSTSFKGRVRKWIDIAVKRGDNYTSNEPFKLRYFKRGGDGLMKPNKVRFTGNKIGVFSSMGGSNVDQLLAMIVDNSIMYTIGYPTGGYSNTWEYSEVLNFRNGSNKVLRYYWSIGHTIRPNGEVLEGNPAQPDELIKLTNKNGEAYWDFLVTRALKLLSDM